MSKETTFAHPPKGHVAIAAYDSANDQWQAIYVDDSGRIQVDVAAAEALSVNLYGWDGSAARKLALLWGYSNYWEESFNGTATGAIYVKDSSVVPAGEVWVMQIASLHNHTRANTSVSIRIHQASGGIITLAFAATQALDVPLIASGTFALKTGDWIRVYAGSTQNGDALYGGLSGYKMEIDQ